MDRKTVVTRVLVIAGTILALFPLVATMVTSIIGSIMNRKFLMDYLMPAELGLFYLTGGIFLVLASFLVKAHRKLITVSFGLAEALFLGFTLVADASGLASGSIASESEKTFMTIVFVMLGFHILCMLITDIGAILLWKDILGPVFRRRKLG